MKASIEYIRSNGKYSEKEILFYIIMEWKGEIKPNLDVGKYLLIVSNPPLNDKSPTANWQHKLK